MKAQWHSATVREEVVLPFVRRVGRATGWPACKGASLDEATRSERRIRPASATFMALPAA